MDARVTGHQVSAERLMRDVRVIAQWERLSGTPSERKAFDYIERELRAAGLRTKRYQHDALISLPLGATLRLTSPQVIDLPCITHSFAATARDAVEADAVYVDRGIGASDPPRWDLAGRIAVADGLAMPVRVAQMQAAGARAVVFLNRDPQVHEMIVSTVWGSPTPDRVHQLPSVPVVSTAGKAAETIRQTLLDGRPVRVHITSAVQTGWRKLPILTADLPGSREDTFILLAGHVDSWYVGAMDNGGANAAMMEVGRLLAKTKRHRGLRLAFWSGHSHGRYAGSTWYADNFWDELDRRCAVHLYIDSIGGRGASLLDAAYCMPEARPLARRLIKKHVGQEFRGTRVGRSGDQSFLGIGIPSLFMTLSEHPTDGPEASHDFAITGSNTGGLGWWWHTPDDTADKLDPANLARDAEIYAAAVQTLCVSPVLPLDYGETAADLLTQLRHIEQGLRTSGGGSTIDLSACLAETRGLERAARALRRKGVSVTREIAAGGRRAGAALRTAALLNRALMRLGRTLIPVLYTRAGRFDHDPATAIPLLPPLAGADALMKAAPGSAEAHGLTIALTRGRNLLQDALRRARETAEEAVG